MLDGMFEVDKQWVDEKKISMSVYWASVKTLLYICELQYNNSDNMILPFYKM